MCCKTYFCPINRLSKTAILDIGQYWLTGDVSASVSHR